MSFIGYSEPDEGERALLAQADGNVVTLEYRYGQPVVEVHDDLASALRQLAFNFEWGHTSFSAMRVGARIVGEERLSKLVFWMADRIYP